MAILTQEIADKLIYNNTVQEDKDNAYFEDNVGEVTPIYIAVDYQCTVSMSNYNVICEMLGHNPDALNNRGSYYGGRIELEVGVEYPSELIDSLLKLEEYPLICEESHSEIEWEIIEADCKELLDEYIYHVDDNNQFPIIDKIEKLRHIEERDFQVWLYMNWTQYIEHATDYVESGSFHLEFTEELDTELVFQDFLIDYEKAKLNEQGYSQETLTETNNKHLGGAK